LNFLVAAFVIQWHMLIGGFMHQVFHQEDHAGFHKIEINLGTVLLADFAAAATLITFGALLGKVTPTQLLILGFLQMIFFTINENVILKIGIMDVGGSVIVHVFGAYFGLAASWVLTKSSWKDDPQNAAVYHSDLFAMIGTIFLFVFWPSFVSAPAGPYDQERAIIATLLALVGSCVTAFAVSKQMRGHFSMVDVQNATLAGGVAIGSAANLVVLSPGEALLIGVLAGILSVLGYTVIQPKLQSAIGLHDTCGVNNLHGMPGILGAIASAIVCAYSSRDQFPSRAHQIAVYGARELDTDQERTAGEQAGYQILCLVVCLAIAIISGAACALVVKFIDALGETNAFVDSSSWEVPELEIPFYFDQRGEINRDMLMTSAEGKPSMKMKEDESGAKERLKGS
jgi:ammonium transporter Rh